MPQMNPIWWFSMFIIFLISNYFKYNKLFLL